MSTVLMAQDKDTIPAKSVIEKGTTGDLILGKENKKKHLTASPQSLQRKDSLQKNKIYAPSKKKKYKDKNCKKS